MVKLKEKIFEEVQEVNNKYLFLNYATVLSIYKKVTNGLKAYEVCELKEELIKVCQEIMIKTRKELNGANKKQILIVIR